MLSPAIPCKAPDGRRGQPEPWRGWSGHQHTLTEPVWKEVRGHCYCVFSKARASGWLQLEVMCIWRYLSVSPAVALWCLSLVLLFGSHLKELHVAAVPTVVCPAGQELGGAGWLESMLVHLFQSLNLKSVIVGYGATCLWSQQAEAGGL